MNAADDLAARVEPGRGRDRLAHRCEHVRRMPQRREQAGVASVLRKRGKVVFQRPPQVRMTSQRCDFARHHATQAPCKELRQQQDMGDSPEKEGMLDFEKMELGTQVEARGEERRKGVLERIPRSRVGLARRLQYTVFVIGSDNDVARVVDQHGSSAMGDRDDAANVLLARCLRELAQQPSLDSADIELLDGRRGNGCIWPLAAPDNFTRSLVEHEELRIRLADIDDRDQAGIHRFHFSRSCGAPLQTDRRRSPRIGKQIARESIHGATTAIRPLRWPAPSIAGRSHPSRGATG